MRLFHLRNNSGAFGTNNPDIRFSMADRPSSNHVDNWAKILWPTVDKMKGDLPTKEAALRILQEKGVKVDNADHVCKIRGHAYDHVSSHWHLLGLPPQSKHKAKTIMEKCNMMLEKPCLISNRQ